ncbi:MAG: magnesium chelatase [Desulfobacterium sp.]|nr:magnesium chelatase [Desulfobacterium sp.]
MDRIDIQIEVPAVPYKDLFYQKPAEPSEWIRERVIEARNIQKNRYQQTKIYSNSRMGSKLVQKHCRIQPDSEKLLMTAIDKLNLSARAYYRILKIARTIADLDDQADILTNHVAEAIQYRSLDRSR